MTKDFKTDPEQLNDLRRRLYARDGVQEQIEQHGLEDNKVDVSRNWKTPTHTEQIKTGNTQDLRAGGALGSAAEASIPVHAKDSKSKNKRHYRSFVLIGSLLVFIVVAAFSSFFLFMGGNQISNDNIGIAISGPPLIGGGEILQMQVGVTNQNSVAIESATLIMKYPDGTRAVGNTERNVFEERIPISNIASGEVRNIPVEVSVFGEENAQKEIFATIEYRIQDSNGMFYKESEPLQFRISSSPLVLRIEHTEKVAAGQTSEIKIIARSNASTPINNILVSAEYPNGFDYKSATPRPIFGEDVWRINQLNPEESFEIVISGSILGLTEESFRINFDAGPARSDNQYVVGSILAEANADFTIERPFIDVDVLINGDSSDVVTLPAGRPSIVGIRIANTLDEPVYDMVVEVVPEGSAIDLDSIESESGFYDSNSGTVRWEVANNPTFVEIQPGKDRRVNFSIQQGQTLSASAFDLTVNVYARRVDERSATEQLIGSITKEGKYSSVVLVGSQISYNTAFTNTGPIPPTVGQETTYTTTMVVEAGANDLEDGVVRTSLPVYVTWLGQPQGDGEIVYNDVSKQIEWRVGNIPRETRKEISFPLGILPSVSQIGITPILLNKQELSATDRFTGDPLQAVSAPITTELSTEAGHQRGNGIVQGN